MDLQSCIVFLLFSVFRSAQGTCVFPSALQGTWETSSRGTIEITSTDILQYPTEGMNLFDPTQVIKYDFTCKYQHDDLEFVVRTPLILYGRTFYLFTCLRFVEVNSDLFYYYHITVADILGLTTPEDVILLATDDAGSDRTKFCGKVPTTINYQTLLKQGTASNSKMSTCPSSIFGEYTYKLVNSGGSFCESKSTIDVCTDKSTITFDYTQCAEVAAYSAAGSVYCLLGMEESGTTYVTLYNTDTTTDESTTYRFSCLALAQEGTDGSVKATYFPEACETTQTSTVVTIPSGGTLSLTPQRLCPIIKETPTEDDILPAILIPVCLVIFILLLVAFLYWCYRRQRKRKYAETKDAEDHPSDYSSDDSGRGTIGSKAGRRKRKRKRTDDITLPWKPKELTPEEMEQERQKQSQIRSLFRGGKTLYALTSAFKPKKKKKSAWVKGRKADIQSVSESVAQEHDVTELPDIPGFDPHKSKYLNMKNIESGLRETGVIKDGEEESRKKRRQEAGFTGDVDEESIIDVQSLNGSDGEGVTFRDLSEDEKISKMKLANKTPRDGRVTSFSRPVTQLMTERHREDGSEYDTRVSDDETLSLDLSDDEYGSMARPSRKPVLKRRKRIHVGRDGLRSESGDTELSEFDIMKRLQKEKGKDEEKDSIDLDDLEKARLILKSRLFDGRDVENRMDEIAETFNDPASAKRFLLSLRERRESFIGREQRPAVVTMVEDTDRQSVLSDVRHSTPHIVDTGEVRGLAYRPGTSWQATRSRINQDNSDNQSGRWAMMTDGKRISTGGSVGRSLTWDEKERFYSTKEENRSRHRRIGKSLTNDELPRRPHTTPGGQSHGVSPLVRIHREQTPSIYSYNFNPNAYKDIDDARLKKLLEELYKDKKFLDYVKATDKNQTKDMAQHGIDFLLWRALFWEERGILPQRPPTSSVLSSSIRTNIRPKMYAAETATKKPEMERSKTVL